MFEYIAAFLATLGINPAQLFAGLAGAFVRTVIQKQPLTWAVLATSVVGALCAIYLTPIIGLWLGLNLSVLAVNNALSFGIGLVGMSLAEGLVTLAHNWSRNPRLMRSMDAKGIADAVNDHAHTAQMKKPEGSNGDAPE
ncbi:hypothetical protein [Shinella oryzae]|uniref:hypothetical protein n=1 Tax=Shinella oryzae TaxID=2871820 RepID=UPI001FF38355|nr:hypothetical protein [Shinella oryzae]UPA25353.1 hypothetical protein K6301_03885 [Shinella oryzae]